MRARILFIGILFVLAAIPCAFGADTAWVRLADGIQETDVRSVAVDPVNPSVLFAGTNNTIYKSVDAGKSWTSVCMLNGTFKAVNSIVIHPVRRDIIVAATQNGLHMTRDAGRNWTTAFKGNDIFTSEVLHAAFDRTDPNFICVATARGLYITTDGAATWNRASGEPGNLMCRWVAFDPSDSRLMYIATHKGVYGSVDRGDRWERIYVVSEEEFPYDEIEAEELFQDDELLNLYGKVRSVTVDPLDSSRLFIACFNGVFRSLDRGRTWARMPEAGLTSSDMKMVLIPPHNSVRPIYATCRKGAFVFLEKEGRWTELYEGITSRDFRYITLDGQKPAVLWAAMKDGVYRIAAAAPTPAKVSPPEAAGGPKVEEVLKRFDGEPNVGEVQRVAMRYAEVQPEKIEDWRKQARLRHWFPTLNVTNNRSVGKTIDSKGSSTNPFYVIGPDDESRYVTYSLNWDLSNIIWSSDQTSIDTRSRLTTQLRDDVLDEATKTYFERRRLQVETVLRPTSDVNELMKRELRVQELTAQLDSLTGGWFSSEIQRRSATKNAK